MIEPKNDLNFDQKILLLILNLNSDFSGNTRFQKLVFLFEKNFMSKEIFDFKPYHYGPFSKKVAGEIDKLVLKSYVEKKIDENTDFVYYRLNRKGQKKVSEVVEYDLKYHQYVELVDYFKPIAQMSLDQLLQKVYSEYPEFTTKSKIKHLFGD